MLRTTSVAFEVFEVDLEAAHRLVSAISDTNPGRLELPDVYPSTSVCIRDTELDLPLVTWEHTADHRCLLFSSEGHHGVSFQDVAAMAHSLLEAGYEYGIKLAFYDSQRQSWIEQDQKFLFRVEDYEY